MQKECQSRKKGGPVACDAYVFPVFLHHTLNTGSPDLFVLATGKRVVSSKHLVCLLVRAKLLEGVAPGDRSC